jgi:hypothetical protein
MESQLEAKSSMYNEIVSEFEAFEGKIAEFEDRESQHIEIVSRLKYRL